MRIIVEGLDCVGKTTIAKYLSETLNIPYYKIKRTVSKIGTQQEVTQRIIDETSLVLADWNGVLDRGYFSALATGLCYEKNLDYSRLVRLDNLRPDLSIIVTSNIDAIRKRTRRSFSNQDKRILGGGLFEKVQDWMINTISNESYYHLKNDFKNYDELKNSLDKCVNYINENIVKYKYINEAIL